MQRAARFGTDEAPGLGRMRSSAGVPTTPRADVWIVANSIVSSATPK
jgi:hypothetical protein